MLFTVVSGYFFNLGLVFPDKALQLSANYAVRLRFYIFCSFQDSSHAVERALGVLFSLISLSEKISIPTALELNRLRGKSIGKLK